jgi:HEAT repeat protein
VADAGSFWNGRPLSCWIERLQDRDDETRWRAVDAVRHLASPSVAITLCAAVMRRDRYWRARALAAHALYDIAWDGESRRLLHAVIPELAEALRDESDQVRLNVAYTLELLGSVASAAIPALREATEGADDELRRAVTDALAAISGGV